MILILPEFLHESDCVRMRNTLESAVYDIVGDGEHSHSRYDFKSPELSARIQHKLSSHLPRWIPEGWYASRYTEGEKLGVHADGKNSLYGDESVLTLLIYLNDDFEEGETIFVDREGRELDRVTPQTGKCVLLSQSLLHKAISPRGGSKLIIRSDVMSRKSLVGKI
jgi:predicted 2-oxoglutarate/Fe(II)-dependent dioxygenase YbiX